ncbi:Helix-turn-helix domain-containing protein [Geodermatophilus amargosae]|uniref:Helix-turn-helix domain-containing protein n=1 Tax=Geodermatophilus amargosae TaxID=1296565 RepID=A0A1I7D8U3_9ACTN|nr:helix-turn-helix transcriptional regulator [Geodermatophilus amargosae]SFU07994.1 Helix-turn-helix domain-containing protein [Geodermatophilus amargosae]
MPTERAAGRLSDGMVLLGVRLREIRKERDERLEDVSGSAGLTASYLSDLERGTKLPSLPTLLALADHYGVLVTDLLAVYPFGVATRPRRAGIKPPADGRRRVGG